MSDFERSFTIRLSAVMDRSTAAVGQPMADSMAKARKRVESDADGMARSQAKLAERTAAILAREAERAAAAQTKASERSATAQEKAAQRAAAAAENASTRNVAASDRARAAAERLAAAHEKAAAQAKAATDRATAAQTVAAQKAAAAQALAHTTAAERAAKAQEKATADRIRFEDRWTRVQAIAAATAAKKKSAEEGKAFDEKLRLAQRNQRELDAIVRQEHRAAERQSEAARRTRERENIARRTDWVKGLASGSFQNMTTVASGAMRLTGDIARGAGANFDIGNYLSRVTSLEQIITNTTNSAYVKGASGPAGQFQDPKAVMKEVRGAASAASLDTLDVGKGVAEFVKRTGDLQTVRDMMKDLAVFAKGTDTSFADTAAVAAEISNVLGDIPNKAPAIMRAMRGLTAEGKLGAVEFSDLAKQFGKLAAASGKFAGQGATQGEQRVDAILKLGAMAQLGRAEGGAWNANTAMTALTSFTGTLSKGARRKEFAARGIQLEDERGYFINPIEIIKQSLEKTGGNQESMDALFKDVMGKRAIDAYTKTYREAGGGKKGLDAVDEKFEGIFKGTRDFTQQDIETQAARAKNTAASKVQDFNNNMEKVAASLAERVLPALEKLEPKIVQVVEALASMVSWAAENPGQAITAAIIGSIAKAALGTAVEMALGAALKGAIGGAGGLGALGSVGTAGALLAVGAASIMVTKAAIEVASSEVSKGQNKSADADAVLLNAHAKYNAAKRTGQGQEEALAELEKSRGQQAQRIKAAEDPSSYLSVLNPFSNDTLSSVSNEKSDADKIDQLRADMQAVEAAIMSLKQGSLRVTVDNMPAGGPNVPQNGRRGIGG